MCSDEGEMLFVTLYAFLALHTYVTLVRCFSQHHAIPASLTHTLVHAVTLCTLLATYHGYSIASQLFGDGALCTLLSTHHGYWSTDSHTSPFSTPLI